MIRIKLSEIFIIFNLIFCSFFVSAQNIDTLLHKLKYTHEEYKQIELYNSIATQYQRKALYSDAILYASKAIHLSRKINSIEAESIACNIIAVSYLRMGEYEECLKYQRMALGIAEKRRDNKDIAAAYNNIGVVYTMQGNYSLALPMHLQALGISEEINDEQGIATSHGNAGNVYFYMKDYTQTRYHYRKAQDFYAFNDFKLEAMIIEVNIGNIYLEQDEYEKALQCYLNALKMNDDVDNPNIKADIYINLSTSYSKLNRDNDALSFALLAVEYKQKVLDSNGLSNAYNLLGSVYLKMHNSKMAMVYLKYGYYLAKEIGSLNFQKEALYDLYQMYQNLNQYDSALYYYKEYKTVNDSLNSISVQEIISDIKVKYETDKKDSYIKLLSWEKEIKDIELKNIKADSIRKEQSIQLIENANRLGELKLRLQEKGINNKTLEIRQKNDKLKISMLSNDLNLRRFQQEKFKRRNITIISFIIILLGSVISILWYQRRRKDYELNLAIWELKAVKNQMKPHFIFNVLSSIHSYILKNSIEQASSYLVLFSKLIRKILNSSVSDFNSLSEELEIAEMIIELEGKNLEYELEYSIDIQNDIDVESIFIPALLLQTFIENAIWHGIAPKGQNGNIAIKVYKELDHLIIEILDDGIGRLDLVKVTSRHTGPSMGLSITEERLRLLSKKYKKHFSFMIFDLPVGLRVVIQIPILESIQSL